MGRAGRTGPGVTRRQPDPYHWPNGEAFYRILYYSNKAIAAGCRDPEIHLLKSRSQMKLGIHPAAAEKDVLKYYPAMQRSGYPPCLKAYDLIAALHAAAAVKPPWPGAARKVMLTKLQRLFPAILAEKGLPGPDVVELMARYEGLYKTLYGARAPALRRMIVLINKARPLRSVCWDVKGISYINYAWDARGFSPAVPPDRLILFVKRLAVARAALQHAYGINPRDYMAATLMIMVDMGLGRKIPDMNRWFHRAIDANPDDFLAYSKKKRFLYRRWGGSRHQLLRFARQCAANHGYAGGVRFMACLIYNHVAAYNGAALNPYTGNAFFKHARRWKRIDALFTNYLRRFPHDYYHRWWLAQYAAWCGHWRIARQQIALCGKHLRPRIFGLKNNAAMLREFVKTVNAHVKK